MLYTLGQYIVNVQSSTTSDVFLTIFIFGICKNEYISTCTSGGIQITVTGENMDSVAEPIMVVVVVNLLIGDPSIFYQVGSNHLQRNHLSKCGNPIYYLHSLKSMLKHHSRTCSNKLN